MKRLDYDLEAMSAVRKNHRIIFRGTKNVAGMVTLDEYRAIASYMASRGLIDKTITASELIQLLPNALAYDSTYLLEVN
jgi:hypothetical protein